MKILCAVCIAALLSASCGHNNTDVKKNAVNPKIAKLKLQPGFKAEHMYSPSEKKQGSWVAMTFDNKGRLIASDQYGALYRMVLAPLGTDSVLNIEKLDIGKTAERSDTSQHQIDIGFAQGLLYAFNSLYVMVNHESDDQFKKGSGLYRLQDTDGDDQYDKITLLRSLEGSGEHGPHSIVLAPDKKSLYLIAGNYTNIPTMDTYRLPKVWQEDNLLPLILDPRGHAVDRMAPGGWIARIDSLGKQWELISAGYRNAFDIAFNEEGELFSYDSDMEWDLGMPWYCPTRICHVTSGSEFGWRTSDARWSSQFPDNLPAVINIGQGSPTNLVHGWNSRFPEKYKKALFASDWSFGIIYAIYLKPNGATYSAEPEEFLSGVPLPLTDGAIGPDGALYFLTGGRRLESDLYRIYYGGEETKNAEPTANEASSKDMELIRLRRELEKYHGKPEAGAIDFAWPYLKHEDRFIRYAARVAVEHQPVGQWQGRALNEKDPQSVIELMIALAHQGKKDLRNQMLKSLTALDFQALSEPQQTDLLRTMEITLSRMGLPERGVKTSIIDYLNPHYPSNSNAVNRGLSKLLVYLEAPQAIQKTLALIEKAKDDPSEKTASNSADLILRNPQYGMAIAEMLAKIPPAQQIYYAVVLSAAKTGWTPELHEKYFAWFKKAFQYQGGYSYIGYINKARTSALKYVLPKQFEYYNKLSGGELLKSSGADLTNDLPTAKGPGQDWEMKDALPLVEKELRDRNFEQGKMMFAAARCGSCHNMRGQGGSIGPDLSQLGTRFTPKDILESIIDPDKVVSDQFAATTFTMKDGSSVLGRLIQENNDAYVISQNPFTPEVTREISKDKVASKKYSYVSIMYPGLINSLNEEELKDLLAYLMAGGDPKNPVYKSNP